MKKIKVGVVGLGNLGKACIEIIKSRKDEFELVAVFSRRAVEGTVSLDAIETYKGKLDVMLMCVGSSEDAPVMVPKIAKHFCTVDSFDTHAKLPQYITAVKKSTSAGNTTAVVATGWDPGLLSLLRIYADAVIPASSAQTFWGPGVSMGHTNAIKGIEGVQDAIQFTVPKTEAITKAKQGVQLSASERHKRVCYVVALEQKHAEIEQRIKEMPNYFAGYETEVNFITQSQFNRKFKGRGEHAGQVITADSKSRIHFNLKLKSNSYFTASAMLAYAIANYQLQKDDKTGVFTVADIAPKYLVQGDFVAKV